VTFALSVIMLSVIFSYCYAGCYYDMFCYAECHYAECRGAVLSATSSHAGASIPVSCIRK